MTSARAASAWRSSPAAPRSSPLNDPPHSLSEVLLVPATFALAWLGGFAQRERAEQALEAEERARHAEREREVAARIAVAEERARIARELHDIVAHAVSVMVLQVGAVRHRLPGGLRDEDVDGAAQRRGDRTLRPRRDASAARRDAPRATTSPSWRPSPDSTGSTSSLGEIRRAGLAVSICGSTASRSRCRRRSTSPPTGSSRKASRMPSSTHAPRQAACQYPLRRRRAAHRGQRRRRGRSGSDRRRPGPRPRRRPRAREALRRRDDRRRPATAAASGSPPVCP